MSIATMADRSLPLAQRVEAYRWADYTGSGYAEAQATLLADIAAADRLARADVGYWGWVGGDSCEWGVSEEHVAALAAYRARMAQGVDRG